MFYFETLSGGCVGGVYTCREWLDPCLPCRTRRQSTKVLAMCFQSTWWTTTSVSVLMHTLRSSFTSREVKEFAIDIVRSRYIMAVLFTYAIDYSWPMWNSSLTAALTKALESLRCRAIGIIFQDSNYTMSLVIAGTEHWSYDATSWPSASSSAVSCRSRNAFTVCHRTSAIPLSRTDCDVQETLKSRTVKFQNSLVAYTLICYV